MKYLLVLLLILAITPILTGIIIDLKNKINLFPKG